MTKQITVFARAITPVHGYSIGEEIEMIAESGTLVLAQDIKKRNRRVVRPEFIDIISV
ncbi:MULTISPECIES: hypothetical protein [unclassified Arcicella]|uniref:hypothetical protein n=1 Tax=unclassified Arcicella TaxID=2644986 RepID=UPI00286744CE|nr:MULTISPECIES: hypothetical protein [unclassified Arcicella]MDR6564926.1 hypothetical protein [Arcicella sp. BE51]MDR6814716.1 hypothetical protein [Arcicella sp. BE140]MDR6826162.1 hypothetical protein [Arcicella sp. BE139]